MLILVHIQVLLVLTHQEPGDLQKKGSHPKWVFSPTEVLSISCYQFKIRERIEAPFIESAKIRTHTCDRPKRRGIEESISWCGWWSCLAGPLRVQLWGEYRWIRTWVTIHGGWTSTSHHGDSSAAQEVRHIRGMDTISCLHGFRHMHQGVMWDARIANLMYAGDP